MDVRGHVGFLRGRIALRLRPENSVAALRAPADFSGRFARVSSLTLPGARSSKYRPRSSWRCSQRLAGSAPLDGLSPLIVRQLALAAELHAGSHARFRPRQCVRGSARARIRRWRPASSTAGDLASFQYPTAGRPATERTRRLCRCARSGPAAHGSTCPGRSSLVTTTTSPACRRRHQLGELWPVGPDAADLLTIDRSAPAALRAASWPVNCDLQCLPWRSRKWSFRNSISQPSLANANPLKNRFRHFLRHLGVLQTPILGKSKWFT